MDDFENEFEEEMMQEEEQNTPHFASGRVTSVNNNRAINGGTSKFPHKLNNRLENRVMRPLNNNPVNRLNKGLNDSIDKADDKTSKLKRDGNPLRNSKKLNNANNTKSVPQALQNNKNNRIYMNNYQNRTMSSDKEEKETDEVKDNYSDNVDNDYNNEGTSKGKISIKDIKKRMRLILIGGCGFLFLFLMILLVNLFSPVESFYSFEKEGTDQEEYVYEDDEELKKQEKKYNERLNEVVNEIREEKGVTIDKYILHALVIYRYYLVESKSGIDSDYENPDIDFEDEDEDDLEDTDEIEDIDDERVEINYKKARRNLKTFANLMFVCDGDICTTDTEENGEVYNNILNHKDFYNYYKNYLVDGEEETRRELLSDIYSFAELAREALIEEENIGFVSDLIQVYLQTCDLPYETKEINGIEVWNNPSATGEYPKSLSITNYLKGVTYGEIGGHIEEKYREGLKAFVISALTFLIRHEASGFNLKNGEMYAPAGDCKQLCCDPTYGCTYKERYYESAGKKYGTSFTGQNTYPGAVFTSVFTRSPLSPEKNALMDEIISEVFGYVMVSKGITSSTFTGSSDIARAAGNYRANCSPGSCLSQNDALEDAKNGMTYIEILNKYYSTVDGGKGFDLINIREGLYFETDGEYNGTIQLNEEFHYHQGDSPWGSQKLCDSGAIKSNGCNITSAAIAISLLTNQRITPSTLNNRQNEIRTCNRGSRPQMIMDFAKMYGLTATEVKKRNKNAIDDMLKKIATGNYVAVARLAQNSGRYKTENGHYIAIVGVKTENGREKLLVWDPGSSKPSRDNYWADLNEDILDYLQNDYSFILIGRN